MNRSACSAPQPQPVGEGIVPVNKLELLDGSLVAFVSRVIVLGTSCS